MTDDNNNNEHRNAILLSQWIYDALAQRLLHLVIVVAVTARPTWTMQNRVKDHREREHAEQCCVHVARVLVTLNATVLSQKLWIEHRGHDAARNVIAFNAAKHCNAQQTSSTPSASTLKQ